MFPRLTSLVRSALHLLLPVLVAGCVATPVAVEPRVLEGRPFTDAQLDFVRPGATTRQDVIASIGRPTIWLAEQRILVYGLRKVAPVGTLWFIGAGPGGAGGVVEGETREAIFFALDGDSVVMRCGRASVDRGQTWLGAALDWTRAEGLEVQSARGRFVEEAPTAESSLIYFYRPRDYQHVLPLVPPAAALPQGVATFADIRLGNQLVGQIRRQSYAVVRVSPGAHEFVVDPDTDDVANPGIYRSKAIRLNIEPGTTTFIEVGVEAGQGVVVPVLARRSYADAMATIVNLRESW